MVEADDSQQLDEQMEMLYGALLRLDTETENEALKQWIISACDAQYGVVDGLVANFIDYLDDKKYVTKILKILKKISEHIPHESLPQLCANIYFPPALVKYLETTELKDIAGDAFIMLVNLFDEKTVKCATKEFVQKLIESIPHIVDQDTVYALLSILVCVLPYFEKTCSYDNIVLDEFLKLEVSDFYKGNLMYLANRGSMYRLDKCMHTIECLMTNKKSQEFFNDNDLNMIVDIGLRELGTPNSNRARVRTLRVLRLVLEHPSFWESNRIRLQEFNTTLEDQILHEDDTCKYTEKERVQLSEMHLRLMLMQQK